MKKLALCAVPRRWRSSVEHGALDVASGKLHEVISSAFSSYKGTSLDPMHLPFNIDKQFKKFQRKLVKSSLTGRVARTIMGKFSIPDATRKSERFYTGSPIQPTQKEKDLMSYITGQPMRKPDAKRILLKMNPKVAVKSREEFVELVAAVVSIYTDKLDVKTNSTTLRNILTAACQPPRIEWYLNNVRFRSRLSSDANEWLGTGTTRNENLHALLNAQYSNIVSISKQMLIAELQTWLTGEMVVFVQTFKNHTTVGVKRADRRAIILAKVDVFTDGVWKQHVASKCPVWTKSECRGARVNRKSTKKLSVQEEIYQKIQSKAVKGKRKRVYSISQAKRCKSTA
jgi:hypothetical protein